MSKEKNPLVRSVEQLNNAARDVRLAGLGVLARVQERSEVLFAELVREGEGLQQRAQDNLNGRIERVRKEVKDRVQLEERVAQARNLAADNAARVESLVQQQVGRVLNLVGVPSTTDIQTLDRQVKTLNRKVNAISKTRKAA
ncbi:MAG: phasin family protein [Pseudomonadota bacterium]